MSCRCRFPESRRPASDRTAVARLFRLTRPQCTRLEHAADFTGCSTGCCAGYSVAERTVQGTGTGYWHRVLCRVLAQGTGTGYWHRVLAQGTGTGYCAGFGTGYWHRVLAQVTGTCTGNLCGCAILPQWPRREQCGSARCPATDRVPLGQHSAARTCDSTAHTHPCLADDGTTGHSRRRPQIRGRCDRCMCARAW